jgi:hypothetical protein
MELCHATAVRRATSPIWQIKLCVRSILMVAIKALLDSHHALNVKQVVSVLANIVFNVLNRTAAVGGYQTPPSTPSDLRRSLSRPGREGGEGGGGREGPRSVLRQRSQNWWMSKYLAGLREFFILKSIFPFVLGKYTDKVGTVSCDSCAAGKFSASTNQAVCSACSSGRYQSATGQSSCAECEIGTRNIQFKRFWPPIYHSLYP